MSPAAYAAKVVELEMESAALRARLETAWREGYSCGYDHGLNDAADYQWGSGSKHPNTLARIQTEEWQQSDTAAFLGGKQG